MSAKGPTATPNVPLRYPTGDWLGIWGNLGTINGMANKRGTGQIHVAASPLTCLSLAWLSTCRTVASGL